MKQVRVPPQAYRAQDMRTLRAGFARPPLEVGPWVFWIVFDNVMSPEEISREMGGKIKSVMITEGIHNDKPIQATKRDIA